MKMTPDQKEKLDRAKEFMDDLAKDAKKNCDVPITCQICGEYLGYCDNDIIMENLFVCTNCGESE